MIPDSVRCAQERAHQYGADWVILTKEADQLAPGPLPATINDCTEDQLRALLLAQQARDARRRYFRELAAIDVMTGNTPSPFAGLG